MAEDYYSGIYHPEFRNGKKLWFDPEVKAITHKLRFGDPSLGWEGDARFSIYLDAKENRWEVHHIDDRGEDYIVCRSKPGAHLDERLIIEMRKRDRKNQSLDEIDEFNDQRMRQLNDQYNLQLQEIAAEAAYYAKKEGH